jgi:hypothetical protein
VRFELVERLKRSDISWCVVVEMPIRFESYGMGDCDIRRTVIPLACFVQQCDGT